MAQAKSEYAAASFGMGIHLNIEPLADPDLFPGDVITVKGIGSRLAGNYAVFKQTFTLGSSGSSMSLEVVSNASALANQVACRGRTGKTSDAKPKDKSKTTKTATPVS